MCQTGSAARSATGNALQEVTVYALSRLAIFSYQEMRFTQIGKRWDFQIKGDRTFL